MESRIVELEAEASRLLRALESQKMAFEDGAVGMEKKLAEAAKDLASKVRPFSSLIFLVDCTYSTLYSLRKQRH